MGPIYFAWVDATETTFNPAVHNRYDETIFSGHCEHKEGAFPTLSLVIKNPFEGLLAIGRKQWAWLAFQNGGTITPLFFGQLLGIPNGMTAEKITISLVGRPLDYLAQQTAVAVALKTNPFFYDPIFIREDLRSDPNTVLEGYPERWHIDRTSLTVTTSDILNGEDGLEEFLAEDGFYSSLDVVIDKPPILAVNVTANVTWTQSSSDTIDLGTTIIDTFTGESLIAAWPKPGTSLQGGYAVASSSAEDVFQTGAIQNVSRSFSYQNQEKHHNDGDVMSIEQSDSGPGKVLTGAFTLQTGGTTQIGILDPFSNINLPAKATSQGLVIQPWRVKLALSLTAESGRQRTEQISFTLVSDLQPVLTSDPDGQQTTDLSLSGSDVGVAIDGVLPIGDPSRRSFFPTNRGLQLVQCAIARARTVLLAGARVVSLTRKTTFARAIALSCRKNAKFYDRRLAGGSALGKITSYSFDFNVVKGRYDGSVTIGAAIGNAGAIVEQAGTCDYIADDYIAPGYFTRSGAVAIFPDSDVGYTPPVDTGGADDGLTYPLTRDQVVVSDVVVNTLAEQLAALKTAKVVNAGTDPTIDDQTAAEQQTSQNVLAALTDLSVYRQITLKPLTGNFSAGYPLSVSVLAVPKMIDLAAPAG